MNNYPCPCRQIGQKLRLIRHTWARRGRWGQWFRPAPAATRLPSRESKAAAAWRRCHCVAAAVTAAAAAAVLGCRAHGGGTGGMRRPPCGSQHAARVGAPPLRRQRPHPRTRRAARPAPPRPFRWVRPNPPARGGRSAAAAGSGGGRRRCDGLWSGGGIGSAATMVAVPTGDARRRRPAAARQAAASAAAVGAAAVGGTPAHAVACADGRDGQSASCGHGRRLSPLSRLQVVWGGGMFTGAACCSSCGY